MDQSLSGGSGNPSRMTLTLIRSFLESSNIREIIACANSQTVGAAGGLMLNASESLETVFW